MQFGRCWSVNETRESVLRAADAQGIDEYASQSGNCGPIDESAVSSKAPEHQQVDRVVRLLARERVVNHVPRDSVSNIKTAMSDMVSVLRSDAVRKLSPLFAEGVDPETAVGEAFRSVEESLHQLASVRDAEVKHLRKHEAYVKPERRYLGSKIGAGTIGEEEKFYAYDSPLDKTLEAMFSTRPDIWDDVESFKDRVEQRMNASENYDESARISDIIEGVEFGNFYIRLKLRPGEMPLVFIFYYDGLEVVNGLGQARLTHELACFYWALVPISDLEKRLKPENLRLATVCLKRAITHVGIDVVINGRPEDGGDCTSWGAQMRRLGSADGMQLSAGDSVRTFRGGTAMLSADTPAAAEVMGFKKSVGPSTKSVCKGCHCRQHGEPGQPAPYRQPNSFLSSCLGWKRVCAGRTQNFRLRDTGDFRKYLQKLLELERGELSAADLAAWMQEVGVNEFLPAMHRCPFFSLTAGCPMDMMHILLEGTARNLLGAVVWVMIRKWGIDEDDIVSSIGTYAAVNEKKRSTYPFINSSRVQRLREGTDGGVCRTDCDFPGTAMQVCQLPN